MVLPFQIPQCLRYPPEAVLSAPAVRFPAAGRNVNSGLPCHEAEIPSPDHSLNSRRSDHGHSLSAEFDLFLYNNGTKCHVLALPVKCPGQMLQANPFQQQQTNTRRIPASRGQIPKRHLTGPQGSGSAHRYNGCYGNTFYPLSKCCMQYFRDISRLSRKRLSEPRCRMPTAPPLLLHLSRAQRLLSID